MRDGVIHAFSNSIHTVFLAALLIGVLLVLVVWLLPELPLREHNLLDDGQARRGRRGTGRARVAGRAALTAT